jgi:hypothetical protein
MSDQSKYDQAGNASHYDARINTLVLIERTWGTYEAMVFCEITAMKYRVRLGKKDDPELELKKLKWYETQGKRLQLLLGTDKEIKHPREQPSILLPTVLETDWAKGISDDSKQKYTMNEFTEIAMNSSTTRGYIVDYVKKHFKPL